MVRQIPQGLDFADKTHSIIESKIERRIIMSKALKVVKITGAIVISIGIGAVAGNLIKVTTLEGTKKIGKICIAVGSFFVAGLAADAASTKFENTIDRVVKTINVWTADKENKEDLKTEA